MLAGKIHWLTHIVDSPKGPMYGRWHVKCGLNWILKEDGLMCCSHIELVDCKNCLKAYKRQKERLECKKLI